MLLKQPQRCYEVVLEEGGLVLEALKGRDGRVVEVEQGWYDMNSGYWEVRKRK
jgi:hypothetical protein